jgi:hypothetical protein
MSAHEEDRIRELLRQALTRVVAESKPAPEPGIDLWPAVLHRLDGQPAAQDIQSWLGWVRLGSSWFDWALLAGVAVVTVAFPASIPLFLYYL